MPIKINKNLRLGARGPKGRKLRTIAAALTITLSLIAGITLIEASNKTVSLWGVARDLGIGSTIHDGDLVLRQAHLDRAANIYLSGGYQPVGLYVTRDLRAGELLPGELRARFLHDRDHLGRAAQRVGHIKVSGAATAQHHHAQGRCGVSHGVLR